MQCRVVLSKCKSNFIGKKTAFVTHSAAPAGEKFRTVQATEVPLATMILPTIRTWCLGTILRSPPSYERMGVIGLQGGAQSRGGGGDGSGGTIGSLDLRFLIRGTFNRTSRGRLREFESSLNNELPELNLEGTW